LNAKKLIIIIIVKRSLRLIKISVNFPIPTSVMIFLKILCSAKYIPPSNVQHYLEVNVKIASTILAYRFQFNNARMLKQIISVIILE
jgi:hypothetical protein